ncbi:hypothetical protein KA005_71735, partial [bacterium]|nr:hypothetical protein [bacterium]
YETFYGPFIDEFRRYNPVEHYLFKQYASDIDIDDWPCETEGWMKHYANAWKDFDPYARDNAMRVLGQAFSNFVKEQYGPLSWIGTYLNNLWGVISGGISGAGTLKSIAGIPKTSQEVLDLKLYGPKVINEKIFTAAFGSGYDLFFR